MSEITGDMRQRYGSVADWVPADVLPRIDQDELLDRLDEAEALRKSFEAAPADFARGYVERARKICAAPPRDEVEKAAQEWLVKADQAYTAQHAAGCREQARLIRLANPSATRRDRRPSTAQTRHAVALAALKADIAAQVQVQYRPDTARHEQLAVGVAELTKQVAVIQKTAGPALSGVQSPDLTK
ncbi:hypothetical protein HLK59_10220 [Streptomyces sp. S3(2020)]|uniref:hypothetical protein n=1 Tax=Streptomyces sp. S3(2020) TaxID=2732044 RepID=UPI0014878464|nr:hypothetical protein [Streptomyces sp. S3(2020)]NNN30732.1 hypothetical protein [Streptomyces sp. S3(2020)]